MLHSYTGHFSRDHVPEQLQLVKNYPRQIMAQSIHASFADLEDFRRKVSRHLDASTAKLAGDRELIAMPSEQEDLRIGNRRTQVGITSRKSDVTGDRWGSADYQSAARIGGEASHSGKGAEATFL